VRNGFVPVLRARVFERFKGLEIKTCPFSNLPQRDKGRWGQGLTADKMAECRWLKPELVAQIEYADWTDANHLRHSKFIALRDDKAVQDVWREMSQATKQATQTASPIPRRISAHKRAANEDPVFQGVTITHPDRIIDPESGLTKGKLAEYYALVSPYLLRNVAGHALTVIRCPEGITGERFYQRSLGTGLGSDVKPFKWKHKGTLHQYFYTETATGLLQLVQMGTVEFHPWGTRHDNMDCPAWAIFDLDPDEAVPFEAVKLAALGLRQRLTSQGLQSFLRCTGGKGLHIIVPLAGEDTWAKVKRWCESIANQMVKDVPSAYVATMTKAVRHGKIFIDYFRNDYTATAVADFSVRARPGAPVAVPLEWRELKNLKAANQFSVNDVIRRVKRKPAAPNTYQIKQSIPA
jgi:bifunctional non-homologous end joining protein LigD